MSREDVSSATLHDKYETLPLCNYSTIIVSAKSIICRAHNSLRTYGSLVVLMTCHRYESLCPKKEVFRNILEITTTMYMEEFTSSH